MIHRQSVCRWIRRELSVRWTNHGAGRTLIGLPRGFRKLLSCLFPALAWERRAGEEDSSCCLPLILRVSQQGRKPLLKLALQWSASTEKSSATRSLRCRSPATRNERALFLLLVFQVCCLASTLDIFFCLPSVCEGPRAVRSKTMPGVRADHYAVHLGREMQTQYGWGKSALLSPEKNVAFWAKMP